MADLRTSTPVRERTGNLFVDSLSASCSAALLARLDLVRLPHGTVLAGPGNPVEHVYFPVHGVISTVARMLNGGSVEVGLTGREGLSPISVVFGEGTSPHITIVQVAGSAYRIGWSALQELPGEAAEYGRQLQRFGHYVFSSAAQFAACGQLHSIESRYARWLLMVADRTGPTFVLTQEYSAEMLGVRRAGVTVVAGQLREAGLISYHRGHVTIVDRGGLEAVACECYAAVNAELERLLGYRVQPEQRALSSA